MSSSTLTMRLLFDSVATVRIKDIAEAYPKIVAEAKRQGLRGGALARWFEQFDASFIALLQDKRPDIVCVQFEDVFVYVRCGDHEEYMDAFELTGDNGLPEDHDDYEETSRKLPKFWVDPKTLALNTEGRGIEFRQNETSSGKPEVTTKFGKAETTLVNLKLYGHYSRIFMHKADVEAAM